MFLILENLLSSLDIISRSLRMENSKRILSQNSFLILTNKSTRRSFKTLLSVVLLKSAKRLILTVLVSIFTKFGQTAYFEKIFEPIISLSALSVLNRFLITTFLFWSSKQLFMVIFQIELSEILLAD